MIDVLVALEMYSFGDEMLNEETDDIFPARSPLKQKHIVPLYLKGQFVNIGLAVFFIGIAVWIDHEWAYWIAGILGFILIIFSLIATVALPWFWRAQNKIKKKTIDMIASTLSVYAGLNSNGPISATHIKARLEESAAQGVVWPAPLYALLDDVQARTGRF